MTEPINTFTSEERLGFLERANYNLFKLKSSETTIDLLTDSGTGAMSQYQWGAMMAADESYAYSTSWYKFEKSVQDITGHDKVLPTHQGRASERLFFQSVLKYFDKSLSNNNDDNNSSSSVFVLGNTHFDTTRANIEFNRAVGIDFLTDDGKDTQSEHPFKGNLDLNKLETFLYENNNYLNTAMVIVTVTNNTGGGQPVSLENMIQLKKLLKKIYKKTGHKIYMFVDCARFAENSWFIQQREKKYNNLSCLEIAQKMFSLFDGAFMSMKKDGLGNIGGFLTLNTLGKHVTDKEMLLKFYYDINNLLILTEGFPTYGGLAGRDLEALAIGLNEVTDPNYLNYRMATTRYLFDRLDESNVPMLRPPGGHAIYLDGKKFASDMNDIIPNEYLPGQALSVALYLVGGIRTAEVGTVMFSKTDINNGLQIPSDMDLVRLAFPRRVYTQSHVDYIIEVIKFVYQNRKNILKPLKIINEPPFLRHFTCDYQVCQEIDASLLKK